MAFDAGAEMRQAVGVAVFLGMLGVALFGLVFHADLLHGGPKTRGSLRHEEEATGASGVKAAAFSIVFPGSSLRDAPE